MAIITKKRESAGQYKVLQNGHTVAYIVKDKGVESVNENGYSDFITKEGWHLMSVSQYSKWINGNETLPFGYKTLREAFSVCKEKFE
jgi:hypothetical protein